MPDSDAANTHPAAKTLPEADKNRFVSEKPMPAPVQNLFYFFKVPGL